MKKKTAAHSADAAPAEAAGGRSVSLNGGTVDKAEVDKFGAIGAVFLTPRCVALRCVALRCVLMRLVQPPPNRAGTVLLSILIYCCHSFNRCRLTSAVQTFFSET